MLKFSPPPRERERTFGESIADAAEKIRASLSINLTTATIEARLLLSAAANLSAESILIRERESLNGDSVRRFNALLVRRLGGEPIAYITGAREFYGIKFAVTPATLIPRPETEILADLALQILPLKNRARVLDLGCGCGALAISIKKNRPNAIVIASDICMDALAVARKNAKRLQAEIQFIKSDWLAELSGAKFDLIVCNPPYIADDDIHLSLGDVAFEPRIALVGKEEGGGGDGLKAIRRVARESLLHLSDGGQLIIEHGYNQSESCMRILADAGFGNINRHRDLAGFFRACAAS